MAGTKKGKSGKKKSPPRALPVQRKPTAEQNPELNRLLKAMRTAPEDIGPVLDLAEYYLTNRLEDKITPLLEPMMTAISSAEISYRRRFSRLLTFGYVHDRKYLDAEMTIDQGLADAPDSIDLHYALAFLKTNFGDYAEGLAAAEKYLTLYDSMGNENSGGYFTGSPAHRSQLLNFKATACRALTRFEEAAEAFEQSIQADPGNHLPYLNHANMYLQLKQPEKAEQVVQRGLARCGQGQELRMVLQACQRKTTISACLMVKDEEEMLEDCLKSVRDWVDEIVVVDTGSTDRTVEIAESFGAKIFHQPWEGSFSKHRNHSIDQATCDWIFIIDADERVLQEDVPQILNLVNEGTHPFISVNVINVYGKNEEYTTFLPSERLFKRELGFRYKGIVHNQLEVPRHIKALRTGIRIKHYGYGLDPAKMEKKLARSRSLLEQQLAENPDNAFAHFNLSQILRVDLSDHPERVGPEIIEHSGRGIELTDPGKNREKHIHLMCLDQLAWAYFSMDQCDRAIEYCRRALEIKPNYLDPLLLLGHAYGKKQEYDTAIRHYEQYLKAQAEYDPAAELTNVILFHVDSRVVALYAMATIYHLTGRIELAREHYEKNLNLNPGYLEANSRLGRIVMENGEFEKAERLFLRQFEKGPRSHEAALGLAAIYLRRTEYEKAETYYKFALEEKPGDGSVLVKLGRLYVMTDKPRQAAECFERASAIGTVGSAVNSELAAAYFSMEQYPQAIAAYNRVIAEGQGSPETLNDLGNCYFRQSDFVRAEEYYQQALESAPPLALALRNLGVTRARLDRPKEAIRDLEKYLAVNPQERQLFQVIGDLFARIRDFDSAIHNYEKYLQHEPESVLGMFSLAEAYLHMGHTDSARLGYQRVLQMDPHYKPALERLNALPTAVGHR